MNQAALEKKILIIDDDDDFRTMLRIMLGKAGYDILEASNGRSGVDLFLEQHPDLVITDLFMPEQEGLETIRKLKRLNSGIKIIAISGGCSAISFDFLPFAEALGATSILAKPFSRNHILTEITALLGCEN
jgi:CheY-like chemotaxis protein